MSPARLKRVSRFPEPTNRFNLTKFNLTKFNLTTASHNRRF
jgi:hypothetical protein